MKKQLTFGVLLLVISTIAFAHPDHGLQSVYEGFMHPLTGLDHLLMMLAIGIWASKLGGSARWQLPITFLSVMALGALLGLVGIRIFGIETAIAASVMVMGLLLAINLPISAISRIGIVALFAVFHGMAHGVELHSDQGFAALGGMLFATTLLHALGLLLGSKRIQMVNWLNKCLAWMMMLVGGYLLFL